MPTTRKFAPRKFDEPVNLRLRMPEALRKRLEAEAKANERSLNSEIVYRLGQSLGPEGAEMVTLYESMDQRMERKLQELVAAMIARERQKQ
jgi:hypothetical protein